MTTNIITEQEIQQFRAETKGTTQRIHFNNAGASLPPDVVVQTMVDYLNEESTYGGYETEAKYHQQLENVYALIARLINADVDEVAIAENASTAWGIVFNGLDFKKGDVIITSEMEYVTNLIGFLNAQKQHGVEVKVITNDEKGNFSIQALEEAITPQTKLIAVTEIASTTGCMIPIAEIGKIARKHDILYLVDACQSAGHVPIDVKEIGCDLLSATGRKYLRAPRGTGFLYVRNKVQDQIKPIFMDNHATAWVSLNDYELRNDARRYELYEKNRALTLGLGKAIDYALNIGLDRIWDRIQYLSALLRAQLAQMAGITVHDFGDRQCGIVTFSVEGFDAKIIKSRLAEDHINLTVGNAVSTLIYMEKNNLKSVVRASIHYYNTEEEIQILCKSLGAIIRSAIAKAVWS
jgi:cysteine desulfurase/selenocysteine lyase